MNERRRAAREARRARAVEMDTLIASESSELDRERSIAIQMTQSGTRYMTTKASRYMPALEDAVSRMR